MDGPELDDIRVVDYPSGSGGSPGVEVPFQEAVGEIKSAAAKAAMGAAAAKAARRAAAAAASSAASAIAAALAAPAPAAPAASSPLSGVVSGSVAVDDPASARKALSSAVDATVAELLAELRRHAEAVQAEGRGFADMVSSFCAAVDWRADARWLSALACAHLAAAFLAVRHRHSPGVLAALFAGGCAVVLLGERLNALAAARWRLFSTQDYFDGRGVFYSAVVSGPVLLNLVLVVAMYLLQCMVLLADAKAAQIKAARAGGGGGRAGAAGGGGGGAPRAAAAAGTPARRRRGAAAAAGGADADAGATPGPRTRGQARKDD